MDLSLVLPIRPCKEANEKAVCKGEGDVEEKPQLPAVKVRGQNAVQVLRKVEVGEEQRPAVLCKKAGDFEGPVPLERLCQDPIPCKVEGQAEAQEENEEVVLERGKVRSHVPDHV